MDINLIVAYDRDTKGIGKDGLIPWKNKTDMQWFKSITTGNGNNAVIMGRHTYESIGKCLSNRLNIILSNTLNLDDIQDCIICKSLLDAITIAKLENKDNVFIIGGKQVYQQAEHIKYLIDNIYIDEIDTGLTYDDFDTFYIPNLTDFKTLTYNNVFSEDKLCNMKIYYNTYAKKDTADFNYLNLIVDILNNGRIKHTRAGDTLSVFNRQLEFDLRDGIPVLTTKKMYIKGCIHELLWFLKGSNNIKYLVENNTHIWDADAYRYYLELCKEYNLESDNKPKILDEFLKSVLNEDEILYIKDLKLIKYKFGDVGPIYGSQWINWNGINQLDELINTLKTNPDDRRLLLSTWNVSDLHDMSLPPCHYMSQWYVDEMTHEERVKEYKKQLNISYDIIPESISEDLLNKENIPHQYLSCMWQQRSVDTLLGLPFDILSYSIFLSMIAQLCNMVPYKLIGTFGDVHIYKNQILNILQQLQNNPFKYNLATLLLDKKETIYDYTYDDIHINNYKSYPQIKYKLSVG